MTRGIQPASDPVHKLPADLSRTLTAKTLQVLYGLHFRLQEQAESLSSQLSEQEHYLAPLAYGHNYKHMLCNMSDEMKQIHALTCKMVVAKINRNQEELSPLFIRRVFGEHDTVEYEIIQKVVCEVMERGKRSALFI